MVWISIALFLTSSLISFGLIYFNLSHVFSQQIISVVLLASVLLLGKFKTTSKEGLSWQVLAATLISSFLVQILIISSGGLYSPLLIIVHIYTLGAIFLLNSKTPIAFLIMTLALLAAQLKYDVLLQDTFANDPWTAVIYGLSFLIIIPLALYLSHNYFIKDAFTKILRNYIKMQEQKEGSILASLNDLVVVADPTLSIISINGAVEKFLQKDRDDIVGKNFFDIFTLKDVAGNTGNISSLSIDLALRDKASRFVEGFMLQSEANMRPKPVLIQVRPLANPKEEVTQIVFVMSEPVAKREDQTHATLKEAIKRKNNLIETFSHITSDTPFQSVKAKIGLLTHLEEDIYLAQELEDHSIQESPTLVDMVVAAKHQLALNKNLAEFLGVQVNFAFADPDSTEEAYVKLVETQTPSDDLAPSVYSLPIERRFVGIVISKMIEIGILIASGVTPRILSLEVSQDNAKTIYLKLLIPNPSLTESELKDIFTLNNPLLQSKTNLAFGSGMEGYILNKICTLLHFPLTTQLVQNNSKIALEISLNKSARLA